MKDMMTTLKNAFNNKKIIIAVMFYIALVISLCYLLFFITSRNVNWFLNDKVTMFIFICGTSVLITSIWNLIRNVKK